MHFFNSSAINLFFLTRMVWIKFSAFLWNRSSFQTCSTKRINTLYIYHEEHTMMVWKIRGGHNSFTYHRNVFLLELVLLALFGLLCAGSEIGRGIITGDALDLLLLRLGPTLRALRAHRCRARRYCFLSAFALYQHSQTDFYSSLENPEWCSFKLEQNINWSTECGNFYDVLFFFFFEILSFIDGIYIYLRYIWSLDRRWCEIRNLKSFRRNQSK